MIFSVTVLCYQANAQTFGIRGGLSLANMLEKNDDETFSEEYSMRPGFHLGLTVAVPFNEILTFESGLLLTTKGLNFEDEEAGTEIKASRSLFYFDIPLTVKASHDLGGGLKMFGAVGPYVGLGLVGTTKVSIEVGGDEEMEEEEIEWGNDEDEDDLRRLDMGLTFGGGVEINSILVGISYNIGLSNISAFQEDGMTIKNRVLQFSVGYRF